MRKTAGSKYNKIVNKKKRKIERRLKRKQWEEQKRPMFSARNIHYEMAEKGQVIASGGIGAVHQMVVRSGLVKEIDENLDLLKRHVPYHEMDRQGNRIGESGSEEGMYAGRHGLFIDGERFGEQLGIHGNSVIGMESQGMVWIVDAERGKGDAGSEDGVSAVSQYPDKNSVSNTEDWPQDCVSGAWVQ